MHFPWFLDVSQLYNCVQCDLKFDSKKKFEAHVIFSHKTDSTSKKKILILGGGFGGMHVLKELQKKLKELSTEELENTYWEIETGEFLNKDQIKELEQERDQMINSLDLKNKDNVHQVITNFCKKYEKLCSVKYPDAPLPLEILKSIN